MAYADLHLSPALLRAERRTAGWGLAAMCVLGVLLILSGCATDPTIVKVPVPVRAKAPEAVTAPVDTSRRPVFVFPANPQASSCLTADGEQRLKELLQALRVKALACEAWAAEEPQPGDRPP